jgi:hypothetical protein
MSSGTYTIEHMDVLGHAIEKHLSREIDQFYIDHGVASAHDIAIKNDFFGALDLSKFKISSIGRRPARGPRVVRK